MVSCQTLARHLAGVGRKAGRLGGENGNGTTIWDTWYLDSTWTPKLQNQQELKQRGRKFSCYRSVTGVQKCTCVDYLGLYQNECL